MKTIYPTILLLLFLSACAKPGQIDSGSQAVAPTPTPAPVAQAPTCAVFDSCTYSGGLFAQPIYNCTVKTLQAADHPEIPASYFQGETCLTYREDFHSVNQYCGPMNQFPCTVSVQGPGPEAIPELGL